MHKRRVVSDMRDLLYNTVSNKKHNSVILSNKTRQEMCRKYTGSGPDYLLDICHIVFLTEIP